MSGPPNIIPMHPDANFETWLRLFNNYLDFTSGELPESDKIRLFRRLVEPSGQLRGFILYSTEGEAIGFAHYIYHEDTWHPKPLCYLDDVFVEAAFRRQGHGSPLIDAVKAAAQAHGCRRLYWWTDKDNQARKLYDQVAESTKVVYRIKL